MSTSWASVSTWCAACGELGDVDSFAIWSKANIDLYARRNGYDLRPAAAHHWLRKSMTENLRSEDMWRANCIIGGYGAQHIHEHDRPLRHQHSIPTPSSHFSPIVFFSPFFVYHYL